MQKVDAGPMPAGFLELLACCATTDISRSCADRVSRALQGASDWSHFLRLARLHSVQPLLHRSLDTVGRGGIPDAVHAALKRSFYTTAANNVTLVKELNRVQALLDEEQIPIIPFKGPLLAQTAYRSLGLRPSSDLDFLIPAEAFPRVETVLKEGGYVAAPPKGAVRGLWKKAHIFLSRQFPYVLEGRAMALDVHTSVIPPGYRFTLTFDELLDRSLPVSVGGFSFRSFAPEDLLLVLCFHGVKNRWEVLKHYCDVAELLRAHPSLDWEAVLARARAMHAERILYLGLHLAQTVLRAPVPEWVSKRVVGDGEVRRLGEQVIEGMHGIAGARLSRKDRMRLHIGVQEVASTKARYVTYALARQALESISVRSD